MKKLLIILLSLFILVGCGKNESTQSIDNENDDVKDIVNDDNNETLSVDFDIWDIDPVYEFDNIDVDFTNTDTANNYYGSPFSYDLGDLYGYVKNGGGLEVVKNGYFGFMNEKRRNNYRYYILWYWQA